MSDGWLENLSFNELNVRPVEAQSKSDSAQTSKETKAIASAASSLSALLEGYPPEAVVGGEVGSARTPRLFWKKLLPKPKSKDGPGKPRDAEWKLVLQAAGAPLAAVPKQINLPRPTTPELTQGQRTTRSVLKAFVTATGGYNSHLAREGCVMSGSSTMWVSEVLSGDKVLYVTDSSRVTSNAGGGGGEDDRPGSFKLWVAPPGRWHMEVDMGSQRMSATCDGDVIWRNYWLGPTPAKGPVRPLRRLLEGIDPPIIADVFSTAEFKGEETLDGEPCVCIKIMANPLSLMSMSTGGAESMGGPIPDTCDVLEYEVEGFFSKRSGLLVGLRDHHLTKAKSMEKGTVYWERTMVTRLEDFRPLPNGIVVAHSGRSILSLSRRFDDDMSNSIKVWVREQWNIDDISNDISAFHSFLSRPQEVVSMAGSSARLAM